MQTGTAFDAMYRMWGRVLAAQGLAVAMIDFRNCLTPSSAPEIEPFPAGLNDCVSGLKWDGRTPSSSASTPSCHRRRRERRREPDAGDRHAAVARWRHGTRPRAVRAVPVHRRTLAAGAVPVVDRERGHPAQPAPQPRRGRLRHRAARGREPVGVAVVRHRRRRRRPGAARSSASTRPTRCATRASSSTGCCSGRRRAQCRVVMGTSHGMDVFTAVLPDVSRPDGGQHRPLRVGLSRRRRLVGAARTRRCGTAGVRPAGARRRLR